jgi:hypothetical protein
MPVIPHINGIAKAEPSGQFDVTEAIIASNIPLL